MQVSSDGAVTFISAETGKIKDGTKDWYRITVVDEEKSLLRLYGTVEAYAVCRALPIGTPVALAVNVGQGQKGTFLTLKDVVAYNGESDGK